MESGAVDLEGDFSKFSAETASMSFSRSKAPSWKAFWEVFVAELGSCGISVLLSEAAFENTPLRSYTSIMLPL
jgi:hypothetical protein